VKYEWRSSSAVRTRARIRRNGDPQEPLPGTLAADASIDQEWDGAEMSAAIWCPEEATHMKLWEFKHIIAGHGRLAAARKLDLLEVPVIELGHLSPAQKRAYVIADNRLALDAGWDEELLSLELAELSESGYDLTMTGFSNEEIEELLVGAEQALQDETSDGSEDDAADDVPDVPANPVSRPGDVWQIGAHRLICGDATDPAVVRTLMAGEQAALCFTSPPYGNQRDYGR